jgi:predicted nucleotidyltransferase component of viral defense system
MNKVAQLSNEEHHELFQQTANNRGINLQIIEKDFWVCWTLKQLFELPKIGEYLIFKGGTSLSKVYGIIERFSEDIDVAIDRKYLSFTDENELANLSRNKLNQKIEELDKICQEIVEKELLNLLGESFSKTLSELSWQLKMDNDDPYGQTILFEFPRMTQNAPLDYIKPIVKIELGARPQNQPIERHKIQSYSAEDFPQIFENPTTEITVLSAERTFWEKATILHDQFHRPENYKTADRISRHYYDFYQLVNSEIGKKALENIDLLKSVVENKKMFFYRAGANYDDALIGKLHLIPNENRLDALKKDYEKMNQMFFSEPPKFETILQKLSVIEKEINQKLTN